MEKKQKFAGLLEMLQDFLTDRHRNKRLGTECDKSTNVGMVVLKGPLSKSVWRATWKSKMETFFQDDRQILFNMSNFYYFQYSKASESSKHGFGILRNI